MNRNQRKFRTIKISIESDYKEFTELIDNITVYLRSQGFENVQVLEESKQ